MGQCEIKNSQQKKKTDQDLFLQNQLRRIKHKLLIMSGKGGVGKSSVAAALAIGLSKLDNKVGLMDIDLHGPSIPHIFGISGPFEVDLERRIYPHTYNPNLHVVSIECLLDDRDSAVIWRGPIKHGVIKQFISDVEWGDLDYLVIDSPPGTGDEPLSIAQTIPDARAIIVTTPQELALADVRKSINFCRNVRMIILGLVENMAGYVCPYCRGSLPLFGRGGGAHTAARMNIPMLGSLPFDPLVVNAGDEGWRVLEKAGESAFSAALAGIVSKVVASCEAPGPDPVVTKAAGQPATAGPPLGNRFRAAIPLARGILADRFGHCEQFALLEVCDKNIERKELVTPPPHDPGVLPRWIGDKQVDLVIADEIGEKARKLFEKMNIRVVTGAPNLSPEELLEHYFAGKLESGVSACEH